MDTFSQMKITSLHGIGEAKGRAYARMGISTMGDLSKHAVILTVSTAPRVAPIRRGMSLLKFRAFDDSGVCEIVFFNQDYLKTAFPVGSTFRFFGKVDNDKGKIVMSSPAFEPYRDGVPLPPFTPIYPLTDWERELLKGNN